MAVLAQLLLLLSPLPFDSALIVPGYDGYYRAHPLEKLGFKTFIMQSPHCHQPWYGKQITKRPRGETGDPKDFYRFPRNKLWRAKRFDEAELHDALEALREPLKKNYGIFWEFFPNVGPPTPPICEASVQKKI